MPFSMIRAVRQAQGPRSSARLKAADAQVDRLRAQRGREMLRSRPFYVKRCLP
jgi:hypothetical protein